ncbi:MAG: 8-amino-7-oxononanoate synthase [Daejeonella sp.]
MKDIDSFISASLTKRNSSDSLRLLKTESSLIDFCSNDYLSFSRSSELKKLYELELQNYPDYKLGSTGSRLLAGNNQFTEDLEKDIADFHEAEASLLFNSGYDANAGLLSCLPQRGDTIICDEYIHASIIDGARLSHASRFIFRHNNVESLEEKLKLAKGLIYIVVESVYSMDGDEAPLKDICRLANKFGAAVIVDEAHATGIFGNRGNGIVHELGLCREVFARIVTFGKGLGTHGAAILGSAELRTFLINFCRSFIYTTAASFQSHLAVKVSYKYLKTTSQQADLFERIRCFRSNILKHDSLVPSRSAIQVVLIRGNTRTREVAAHIQKAGFDVRAILSPTVPEGSERLRICIHNHNSFIEIKDLCLTINQLL